MFLPSSARHETCAARIAAALCSSLLLALAACAQQSTSGDGNLDPRQQPGAGNLPGAGGDLPGGAGNGGGGVGNLPGGAGTGGGMVGNLPGGAGSGSLDAPLGGSGSMDPTGGGAGTGALPTAGSAGSGPASPGATGKIVRAAGFPSLAPPLGEPLPDAAPGSFQSVEIPGTTCRDGSTMKIFYKYSGTSTSYFVFLEGGGVCFDDFFCPLNPADVEHQLDGETVLGAGLTNLGGAAPIPQTPRTDGIFKDDARNPVRDWNMIYVPYCSGDVYGGTRTNATVPRWPAGPPQQFLGYRNMEIILPRIVATFPDAEQAMLTGSSAGGVGSLMNASLFADLLIDNTDTRGFVVSDSGPVFDDPYLEVCVQKEWRELWGLNDAFPPDCAGCRNPDGSGIAKGVGQYLFEKYPDAGQVMGGLISSSQDEIMQLFFGKGLDNCAGNPFYPIDRYPAGLRNFRDQITKKDRFGTYFLEGTLHMHIFRPRFYETNGNTMSIADWLGKLLNNEAVHVGLQ